MTFFYELNKRMANLAVKQTLAEAKDSKPDFLDLDKDGDRKESMKKAAADKHDVDESALQAFIGKKKYGDSGMKALQKAGRDGASKDKMAKIRAQHDKMDEAEMEEGNEFSGELVKARASGAKEFRVDGKTYPVKEGQMTRMYNDAERMTRDQFVNKYPTEGTFWDNIMGVEVKKMAPKKNQDVMRGVQDLKAPQKAGMMTNVAKGIKAFVQGKPEPMDEEKKEARSKGTAFDPEVSQNLGNKDKHSRYDVKDTGYSKRYTRKIEEPQDDNDSKDDSPKKRGRPLSAADKNSERVTKGSFKYKAVNGKRVKKDKTDENLDTDGVMMTRQSNMSSEGMDGIALVDKGEYDREGDMAKNQLNTIKMAATELKSILGDDENLPEWIQTKITLALDYIDLARDYMISTKVDRDMEPVAEKAVSKNQAVAARIARAVQKGEVSSEPGTASAEMARMRPKALKKFAKTDTENLPKKVKETVAEVPAKGKGSFEFGKGVYENMDNKFRQALTEGMNISVNMSVGQDGQPQKNITVSADGDDAEALATLLKMAGMGTGDNSHAMDENAPDYPTNTVTTDDAFQYSGGLNGPKSTGQTTVPVIATQLRRQVSMEENVELQRDLFRLYNNYKAQ